MSKVRYTKLALADVAETASYIARDDPAAAKQVVGRIETAIAGLASHPKFGRPGRIRGTRELVVSRTSFVVPYGILGENIEILAVIHGRRAWQPVGLNKKQVAFVVFAIFLGTYIRE